MGDRPLPRLNTSERPIAHKYREGKVKRTLKRESKEREIAKGEAYSSARVVPGDRLWWQSQPFSLVHTPLFLAELAAFSGGFWGCTQGVQQGP